MSTVSATGWFPHLHSTIGVKAASDNGIPELTNLVMLTVHTGACHVQTYLTVAEARRLAAEIAGAAALVEIGAEAGEAAA